MSNEQEVSSHDIHEYIELHNLFSNNRISLFLIRFADHVVLLSCGQHKDSSSSGSLRPLFFSIIDNVVGEIETRFSERHWEVSGKNKF